jgi:hypothetical protein
VSVFVVVAGPIPLGASSKPVAVRWLAVPPSGRLEVREASAGLEAAEVDRDLGSPRLRESSALLPPLGGAPPGERHTVHFRLDTRDGGVELRVLGRPDEVAHVVNVDSSLAYGEEPRSVDKDRVLGFPSLLGASYFVMLVDAARAEDQDALTGALCGAVHAFDALPDRMLLGDLSSTAIPTTDEPRDRPAWRAIDLALRTRRGFRAHFLDALDDDHRKRFQDSWRAVMNRILHRHGLPESVVLTDEARDWFVHVRAAIERVRNFPPLARDAFALGVGQALDALGEGPGKIRLVPLARENGRDIFRLALSRRGDPEYRVFDVTRTEQGEAIVSGRRVVKASPQQRIRAVRCRCGGRLYERDANCRGCGTKVEDMAEIAVVGTFTMGAAADLAALCVCGGPLGPEDRFCGTCGRNLETLG